MNQMLDTDCLSIDPTCKKLIEVLPQPSRDPDKIGDCIKFYGVDAADCGPYSLKSYLAATPKPPEVRVNEAVMAAEKMAVERGEEFGMSAKMQALVVALAAEKKRNTPWIRPARAHYLNGRRVILSSVRKF
jgi:hypothetical protein